MALEVQEVVLAQRVTLVQQVTPVILGITALAAQADQEVAQVTPVQ
jgi:hypothetical protein